MQILIPSTTCLESYSLICRYIVLSCEPKYATYLSFSIPPDHKVGRVSITDDFNRGTISV